MLRRSILVVLCSFGLTRAASGQPHGDAAEARRGAESALDLRARPEGLGAVRAGMSVAQAERALGRPLRADPPALSDAEALADWDSCHYESTPALPGVRFMVRDGRVIRVDVEDGAWGTTRGVRIGTPEVEVLRRYPGIEVRPHPYAEFGHYLVLERPGAAGAPAAMIFETDGQVVTSFRSGEVEPVGEIDGCS